MDCPSRKDCDWPRYSERILHELQILLERTDSLQAQMRQELKELRQELAAAQKEAQESMFRWKVFAALMMALLPVASAFLARVLLR